MTVSDLGDGIYRIDGSRKARLFPVYTYLITSGDRGVVIDPGPREDFPALHSLLLSILPIERISYVVITGETPDACSSLPLWERTGFHGKMLIHWKASMLAQAYGWGLEFSILRSVHETIGFGDGRELTLLNLPGFPTAGSMVCHDPQSGGLFTGMLFGSIGGGNDPFELEESLGRIEAFHDVMFSHAGDRPDVLKLFAELSPKRVLPRCGPVVERYLPQTFSLLTETTDGQAPGVSPERFYGQVIQDVNQRLADLFSKEEVERLLSDMSLDFTQSLSPLGGQGPPVALLDTYLEDLVRLKGGLWLTLVQAPIIRKLKSRGAELPTIFERNESEIERGVGSVLSELRKLRNENIELQQSIIQASDDQLKDPLTGFYNEVFFEEYLDSLVPADAEGALPPGSVAFVRLDGIQQLNQRFGAKNGDATLKGLGYLLLNNKKENTIFFRMNGPLFACFVQGQGKDFAAAYARELMEKVADSDQFVDSITVSAAVVDFAELSVDRINAGKLYASIMKIGKERLKILDRMGPGSFCFESTITLRRTSGTVLLIEANRFEADLLGRVLEREGFEVHAVTQGSQALAQADLHRPDVVVSAIFVPQIDGFQIRQRFRATADLKNIPFVLVSREKSEGSIQRALELGIKHYFKKPVSAVELGGVIRLLIEEAAMGHST